jgi:hypothetical protein
MSFGRDVCPEQMPVHIDCYGRSFGDNIVLAWAASDALVIPIFSAESEQIHPDSA